MFSTYRLNHHKTFSQQSNHERYSFTISCINIWANQKLLDIILALPEEKQIRKCQVVLKVLYYHSACICTCRECLVAENECCRRDLIYRWKTFKGSMQELSNELLQQNRQWQQWVNYGNDPMLDMYFSILVRKKESFQTADLPNAIACL
jgi:hypothetical protein